MNAAAAPGILPRVIDAIDLVAKGDLLWFRVAEGGVLNLEVRLAGLDGDAVDEAEVGGIERDLLDGHPRRLGHDARDSGSTIAMPCCVGRIRGVRSATAATCRGCADVRCDRSPARRQLAGHLCIIIGHQCPRSQANRARSNVTLHSRATSSTDMSLNPSISTRSCSAVRCSVCTTSEYGLPNSTA